MKTWIGVAVLAFAASSVWAQGNSATVGQSADLGGTIYASTFSTWTIPQGNNGPLTWSYGSACNSATAGGVTFKPLTVGTPVTLVDSKTTASEVVMVTSIRPAGSGCAITVNPSNPHDTFHITTATAGLQEAINYAGERQNVVVITPEFTRAGGTTSTITSAKGSSNVTILDERSALMVPYTWNGSVYAATVFPGGGGGGGSTSAASPGGAVQFNNVATPGTFAGTANFTFDPITNGLNVAGGVTSTGLTVNGTGAANGLDFPEATPATGTGGHQVVTADSNTHTLKLSSNGGTPSDICTAQNGKCPGTAGNPAGPNTSVQLNGNGTSFAGDANLTYDIPSRMLSVYGLTEQDPGGGPCWNPNVNDAMCNWEHFHPLGMHTQSGAEMRSNHAVSFFCRGPSAYNGFSGHAENAYNNSGCIGNFVGGEFRGDGFKRLLDTSLPPAHLNFVGMGDWSVENYEVHYSNSYCCGSDEGGTPFRYQLAELGGYLQTTLASVTTTSSTAPDAAGQGPYNSPTSATVLTLDNGNGGGRSISTGSRIADLTGVAPGCLDPTATFSDASTYYYGIACGTFTGTVASDGTMETAFETGTFIGKIGVAVAQGALTPTAAYGVTTTTIGDQTNRYTNNVGVAQGIPITIHGGTAGVFVTGYACIGGDFIESVRITAVGALSGGAQTITANVRRYHPVGSWVFSGACKSLILHDDASKINPYPYTVFGYVAGNLVVGVQKGGGVNFQDIFRRGSKPRAYGATWSVLNTAEIISDNAEEYQPPIYQVEETGRSYANGDKILGLPFPSRRDNMFAFRDFTANASDQRVHSGLMEESFGGPSPNSVGAISLGYAPDVETNLVQCTNTTYIGCGGWADPPNYAKDILGVFGNILHVPQPSRSTYGDNRAAIIEITPGVGVDLGSTYSLFNMSIGSSLGAGHMDYNSGNGDYYLYSPDNSGFYQSYVAKIGFADGSHNPLGALSDDPGSQTWDLGDGSARGLTNWNLALNNITLKGVIGATSLATDSNGKIVAGSGVFSHFSIVPTGTVDGTNLVFTVPNAPAILWIERNGVGQEGLYTVSGTTITFNAGYAPQPGDRLYAQALY